MNKLRRIPFTKEGFDKLKKEYENLLSSRGDAVKVLQQARELGDLSENGLYKAARAKLSSIDHKLERLKILIRLADVIYINDNGLIGIGSKITLCSNSKSRNLMIVGEMEADPLQNKISNVSPLGKLLLGKHEGEVIILDAPSGKIEYRIEKIINR